VKSIGLLFLLAIGLLLYLSIDTLIDGLRFGSLSHKISFLMHYIDKESVGSGIKLITGGEHNFQFDNDLGYIYGGYGLFGVLSVFTFYICTAWKLKNKSILIMFGLISIGDSVLYSFFSAVYVLFILITLSSILGKKPDN
jgi:hypothetical protein